MTLWERYRDHRHRRKTLQDALETRRRAHRLLRRAALSTEASDELRALLAALDDAIKDSASLSTPLNALDARVQQLTPRSRIASTLELLRSIAVPVFVALVLRAFVVEAFMIPSVSMIPTLQVGDFIFVNKFIYGVRIPFTEYKIGSSWRPPQRGEVIVFIYPINPEQDFIKRVAAVAGDTIEMRDDQLWINGAPIARRRTGAPCEYQDIDETKHWSERYCDAYIESNGGHFYETIQDHASLPSSFRDGEPLTVPSGMVFAMGDNRDRSNDSRSWGFVPETNIKGKAMSVWWSIGPPRFDETSWEWIERLPIAKWIVPARFDRVFHLVR